MFVSQMRKPTFQQPRVPSSEEIEERVRATRPGVKLYQPKEDWHKIEFNGDDYWIPPDLEGTPLVEHPVECLKITEEGIRIPKLVKADGTLEIKDRYGEHWRDGILGQGPQRRKVKGIITSANEFMSFILRNHAQYGVTCLTGLSKEEDEKEKAVARNNYHLYFQKRARTLVQERGMLIHKWMKDAATKDRPLPPPTPEQQGAQEFLDFVASTTMVQGKYACECGYFQGDNFTAYARHMKVNHKKLVTKAQADAELKSRGFIVPESAVEPLPVEIHDGREDELPVSSSAMAEALAQAQKTWPKQQAFDASGEPLVDGQGQPVFIPVWPTAGLISEAAAGEEIAEHIGSGADVGDGGELLEILDQVQPQVQVKRGRGRPRKVQP